MAALLPASTRAADGPQPSPVPDAFVVSRMNLLPALPQPRMQAVAFPREFPAATVEETVILDKRLWLVARARTASPSPAPRRLWTFSPDSNRLEPVKGVMEQYSPGSLFGHGREIWMSVLGGAAAIHDSRFTVEGFNAVQGLASTNLIGFGESEGHLVALADNGVVFGLNRTGVHFDRVGPPAPMANPRAPDPWRFFGASGSAVLAAGTRSAVTRPLQGSEWVEFSESLVSGCPRLQPFRISCIEGDGGGGFWLGSNAGLHWLNPANGSADNWFWPPGVIVYSGLAATHTAATKPSPAAVAGAMDRVTSAIRDRMRDRARLARAAVDSKRPIDPVTPTSRLPGAIRALHRDKQWLWIATTDGPYSGHSRIILFHQPTHKWVGAFVVNLPVNTLCTSDQFVYLGLDATAAPAGNPLIVIPKLPLTTIHSSKWVPDELTDRELGERLAALPVRERAVHAFFARDAARVVSLLGPTAADASAEELFLLAFAHDPLGLDQPARLESYARQILERWPQSPFAEVVRGLRIGQNQTPTAAAPATAPAIAVDGKQTLVPAEPAPSTEATSLAEVFSKWDKNSDGSIDATELRAWQGDSAKLSLYDTDGDGQLGPSEILALLKSLGR